MKTSIRSSKLTVSRETLKRLNGSALTRAQGGVYYEDTKAPQSTQICGGGTSTSEAATWCAPCHYSDVCR